MAKTGSKRRKDQSCTFCGRTQDMVKRLIAGQDGVCICNDCVQLCSSILEQEDLREPNDYNEDILFDDADIPTPRDIKFAMDEYVIGQNFAKRVLSVAVNNHYKRLSQLNAATNDGIDIEKSNVLVIGPSGCGKTLMAKILAATVDVPFAIADATTLTEAGYVGEDVENILLRLIQAADGDISRAEKGIIFIDEIDKIGKKTQNVSITRDVSGEGVQQALLKMLEGTTCNVPPQGGRKHPEQKYLQINTQNILFICGGSFQGLDEVISRRIGHKSIGFHREEGKSGSQELGDILEQVDTDDLLEFGIIPELLGRIPVLAPIRPLDEESLIRVLTEPKNALIKQYAKFFSFEDAELEFTEEALHSFAKEAIKKETGARALRGIVEGHLIDLMFDLPDLPKPSKFVIDQDFIKNGWQCMEYDDKTPKEPKEKKRSRKEIERENDEERFDELGLDIF